MCKREIWRDVVGYESRYRVSNLGRIWSNVRGRILKPGATGNGYLTVTLCDKSRPKKQRTFCVHDLVMAAFVGPKPVGYQVDHGPSGKQCNALDNLEYVTPKENIRRAIQTGKRKQCYGVDHPNAQLSIEQVREIRRLAAAGELQIASHSRLIGVSYGAVYLVARGRSYKSISNGDNDGCLTLAV